MATDPNSSVLSLPGTPLKAIDNICSLAAASSLDESGRGASFGGSVQPVFVRPQQTSTPATRRISPREVAPGAISVRTSAGAGGCVELLRVHSAAAGAGCFSQDGGFLPESQPVGLTPVMPVQRSMRQYVVDLTVDDVSEPVTESQFKPSVISTQICAEPLATHNMGNHPSKSFCRFGNFENSFADNDITDVVAESKFKPVAVSTQISPRTPTMATNLSKLCPRNGNFKNSFAEETMMNGVLENDGGGPMEADRSTGTVIAESSVFIHGKDGTSRNPCYTSAHEPSHQLTSRSPSPELFDCENAIGENRKTPEIKPPPDAVTAPTTPSRSHPLHEAAVPDDHTTSPACTTLAQKLANKRLKADGGQNQDPEIRGKEVLEGKSGFVHGANGSLVEAAENSCLQTRRSARLSTRSKMPLRGSKLRKRGVDFVDEIDEVTLLNSCRL